MNGDRREVVVIGGGQAGLSAAAELRKRGIDVLVLEASDRIGDQWRRRWESLRLYSPAGSDSLPGLRFPAPASTYPSGRQMGDYLEQYAADRRLEVRMRTRVDAVGPTPDGAGFVVGAGDAQLGAGNVVVATGAFHQPRVPDFAADLDPGIRQLHSSEYHDPGQLADGPVLVVGVSHSGADIAHEAARNGHRTFLSGVSHAQLPFSIESRRGRLIWPALKFVATHVLTLDTPIGRRMASHARTGGAPLLRIRMPDLLAAGVEHREARTIGVRDGRPMLSDGTVLDVATIAWCTGFRPDFGWIGFPIVGADGWPRQVKGVSDVPGLYFLGIPFLTGFTSMLVLGAGRDAARVAEHIARRRRAGASPFVAAAPEVTG